MPAAQEAKVGAGEQIIARRRSRRLVPEGTPLNARLSGAASGNLGAADEAVPGGNPMARRAEGYRGRPRPPRVGAGGGVSPPATPEQGGAAHLAPRTDSRDDVFYPARSNASELPSTGSPEGSVGHMGRGDVEAPGVPQSAFAQPGDELPPGVAARMHTYFKD